MTNSLFLLVTGESFLSSFVLFFDSHCSDCGMWWATTRWWSLCEIVLHKSATLLHVLFAAWRKPVLRPRLVFRLLFRLFLLLFAGEGGQRGPSEESRVRVGGWSTETRLFGQYFRLVKREEKEKPKNKHSLLSRPAWSYCYDSIVDERCVLVTDSTLFLRRLLEKRKTSSKDHHGKTFFGERLRCRLPFLFALTLQIAAFEQSPTDQRTFCFCIRYKRFCFWRFPYHVLAVWRWAANGQ